MADGLFGRLVLLLRATRKMDLPRIVEVKLLFARWRYIREGKSRSWVIYEPKCGASRQCTCYSEHRCRRSAFSAENWLFSL